MTLTTNDVLRHPIDGEGDNSEHRSAENAQPRRSLLRALVGLGAAAAATGALQKAAATPPRFTADVDPNALLLKLVRRTSYGPTVESMARANELGYTGFLEEQLNPAGIADQACDAVLAAIPNLWQNYHELIPQAGQGVTIALTTAAMQRALMSRRQLYQRICEFWNDHFYVPCDDNDLTYLKVVFEREALRPNALTTFPLLLRAVCRSTAMLHFLDNTSNMAAAPNQNFARELMELHTLGVDGGYTQQDVEEVARCFTGWHMLNRSNGALSGTFVFVPSLHDDGEKVVLGNVIPAGGGVQDGETVINILASHPSTARHISRKLCRWFLDENVSDSVVQRVAAVFSSTGGDLRAVMRAILEPGLLHDAAPKFKRPLHYIISAYRALAGTLTDNHSTRGMLYSMGHWLYRWSAPDGFPDTFAHWGGLLLPRWNFAAKYTSRQSSFQGEIFGAVFDDLALFNGTTNPDEIIEIIDDRLFGGEWRSAERSIVRDFVATFPSDRATRRNAIGLAISSPMFQWY